jgi:hypothetical protein
VRHALIRSASTRYARRAVSAALAFAAAAWTIPAAAHGGPFHGNEVFVDPGDPKHLIVNSDAWGFAESHDGGASWQWFCAEAYGGNSVNVQRVPMTLLADGDLYVANLANGLERAHGSLCSFEAVPFFAVPKQCGDGPCYVEDVSSMPGTPPTLVVLTFARSGSSGLKTRVWTSEDGDAWQGLPDTVPSNLAVYAARIAPSAHERVYLGAQPQSDITSRIVLSSADGGNHWTTTPVSMPTLSPEEATPPLGIHGVHPSDDKVAFFWLDRQDLNGLLPEPDRVFVTTDGGATVNLAFEGQGDLGGFAFSGDGSTVFLGGPNDGLLRASMDDIRQDPAHAFHAVSPDPVWGLAWTADGLYAGRNDFGPASPSRASLAFSPDYGATFQARMTVCDLSPAVCADAAPGATQCASLFYGYQNFQYDFQRIRCGPLDGGVRGKDGGATAADGGRPVRAEQGKSGCACRIGPVEPRSAPRAFEAALAVAFAFGRRLSARRRRRRGTRRGSGPSSV